ncbi:MAG: hypothetical protein R6X31_10705 [Anaerolineae bacterium]
MTDAPSRFAGKLSVDAWTCVLEKGVGKVPFDPEKHKGRRTSTAIELTVEPLDPTRGMIQRDTLNWTPDFRKVVRPSIEKLIPTIAEIRGLKEGQFNPLKQIDGLYVIGRYVERPDNEPDETWTTLAFTHVFGSEAECKAVYEDMEDIEIDTEPAPEPDNGADPQRAQMAKFLPALWQQADEDPDKFAELIEANPMLADHFDRNSEEVRALTGEVPF